MRWLRGFTRRTWLVNATLGVLALAGGGWAYVLVADPGASASTASTQRVGTVTTGAVTSTVSASGTVASANVANADFVTAGTVTEIDVKVGDAVTKGQVLAKVDPTAANAALTTAKAQLTAAKQSLARVEAASTSDAATISAAQNQVTQAQTTVDTDQRAVDGTVLTAPIAGTVTAVTGAVGANSGGGSSNGSSSTSSTSASSSSSSSSSGFVQISDLGTLQVSASFTEADATKIKVGQSAEVTWTALTGATATGTVKSITPTATSTNSVNSYPVVVTLTSIPDGVRLGQSVTAVVTVASVDNVTRAPKAAVKSSGGTHTVQIRDTSGAVRTVSVEVGVAGDSYVEIKSGLTAGQQVLLTVTTSSSTGTSGFQGGFPGGGGFPGAGGP